MTNVEFAATYIFAKGQRGIYFVMKSAGSILFDISLTLDRLSPIIAAQKFKSFECLEAFRTRNDPAFF
jgi:hypothetical protein